MIESYPPDFAAVEDVPLAANARSAPKPGRQRWRSGAILLGLELANIPVVSYTPLAIKKAPVLAGRAEQR